MAVTGSGPLAPGPDAPRYGDKVQRSMYNGWKSIHGIVRIRQSTEQPIILGITTGRQNDTNMLRESKLLQRWKCQVDILFAGQIDDKP